MDENVKIEDTIIHVSLLTTSDLLGSVSHSIKVEDKLFCADLKQRVKKEGSSIERSHHQIKFQAPDVEFGITSGGHEFYIKPEPLDSEELQIKDEIEQSATYGTTEEPTQFEYLYCGLCNSKLTNKNSLRCHMKIPPLLESILRAVVHSNEGFFVYEMQINGNVIHTRNGEKAFFTNEQVEPLGRYVENDFEVDTVLLIEE